MTNTLLIAQLFDFKLPVIKAERNVTKQILQRD